jgi:hypothetical protein
MEMISGHFAFLAFGLVSTFRVGPQTRSGEWRELSALMPSYIQIFFIDSGVRFESPDNKLEQQPVTDCGNITLKFVCM